jgi:hypothetical protein
MALPLFVFCWIRTISKKGPLGEERAFCDPVMEIYSSGTICVRAGATPFMASIAGLPSSQRRWEEQQHCDDWKPIMSEMYVAVEGMSSRCS